MKIKTVQADWDKVAAMPRPAHFKPRKPNILFRTVMRAASSSDLRAVRFSYTDSRPADIKDLPCLILMNHSSFTDLEIVSRILYPKPYGIVCTADGFVGKKWLMRQLGCIPTQKFVSDVTLIKDIRSALCEQEMSVLMYPEASYSFDGTATGLPDSLGGLIKLLDVPVVMIRTEGAFARDPLYNCLQKRDVTVTADISLLMDTDRSRAMSADEINTILRGTFAYDHFAWQRDKKIAVPEPFRADGLHRILYKCPVCGAEGKTEGKGTELRCAACGKSWFMDEYGALTAREGKTEFSHIPDWYAWERSEVRRALTDGTYSLDVPVRIGVVQDYKAVYMVGEGRLTHGLDGFRLTGCDGRLEYIRKPLASYSLYADYYWYELGDVIIIGDKGRQFCCFPPEGTPVAKARLAAEELYKMVRQTRRSPVQGS